jgi:hypothetical protein
MDKAYCQICEMIRDSLASRSSHTSAVPPDAFASCAIFSASHAFHRTWYQHSLNRAALDIRKRGLDRQTLDAPPA